MGFHAYKLSSLALSIPEQTMADNRHEQGASEQQLASWLPDFSSAALSLVSDRPLQGSKCCAKAFPREKETARAA